MRPSVAVIGTVFVDYKGFAGSGYQPQGRNLGRVEVVPGGVARNVAMNLRYLGLDVWFAGTVDGDQAGLTLNAAIEERGVHTDYLTITTRGGTGVWLAIIGPDGELLGSISQMPDMAVMEQSIIPALPAVFSQVAGVALEVDLSEKLARAVLRQAIQAGIKVYALPSNFSVSGRCHDLFQYMDCFICNQTEAGLLFHQELTRSPADILPLLAAFAREHKLKNFVVTLGEKGALYVDERGNGGFQSVYPTRMVDSTGAGDAFFSATVAALLDGKPLIAAVDQGARVAALVIGSEGSDCSRLEPCAGL
jgi:pseudouridine kinase